MSFGTGLHVMVALAVNKGAWVNSNVLAYSVGVNPVTVRKVLGKLLKATLIETQPGPGGGARLVRSAQLISVGDVYNALGRPAFLHPHGRAVQDCPVSECIPGIFVRLNEAIANEARKVLTQTTLQTLVDEEFRRA